MPLATGDSALAAAERFRAERTEVFGAVAAELSTAPLAPGGPVEQPLMYDRETDSYKFKLVRYQQQRGGVPVFNSDLRVLVRNEGGFPVVLGASSLHDLGAFTVDAALAASPFSQLEQIAPDMTSYSVPQVVIWAGVDNMVVEPVLAITFTADNYANPGVTPESWRYVADAATGAVLYRESLIDFADITGHVQGNATEGYKAEMCAGVVATPMPCAALHVAGDPATYYAYPNADFAIPWAGTDPVTVDSHMLGSYFSVHSSPGWPPVEVPTETLSHSLTPGVPYTFTHNETDSDELVRSQVNAFIAANAVRRWVLDQNEAYPVISTQAEYPIYVNWGPHPYCPCQAWHNATSVNFCSAGSGCPNMAFRSAVYHEYGHHAILSGGSGQGQYGEGMADSFSVLLTNDPVVGYGWDGDCNFGKRTADNLLQYPCDGEIHDCGCLLSGCVWEIRNALVATEPVGYLSILSALAVNSILLHSGTMITPQIAIDFLTLDDDDACLINGTPHWPAISAGFGAHGIECPPLGTGLLVQPEGGLASSGEGGAPASFDPTGVEYTLTNLNETPIDYSVAATESWVTMSTTGGTILGRQSATVAVGIDQTQAAAKSYGTYHDTVTFTNTTDHVGDTTRPVDLTVAIRRFALDDPPDWPVPEGEWAFGQPIGGGGAHGCPDPAGGATGENVYGVNLSGDYSTTPGGPYYLTSAQIDLTGTVNQQLRFKRWLNTDHWPYAEATVEASPDGQEWTRLWSSGWVGVTDHEWMMQTYDMSTVVGTGSTVYVRWGYQVYPGARAYSGWNIDDIEFLGDATP